MLDTRVLFVCSIGTGTLEVNNGSEEMITSELNGSEEMITSELKLGGDHLLAPIVYHT